MATKKMHREPSIPDKKHFEALKPFVEKVAVGTSRQSYFTLCVKASLAKCFEFNLAVRSKKDLDLDASIAWYLRRPNYPELREDHATF